MTVICGWSFCEASYNVIILEWLVDIATKVGFDNSQDVVVPLCKIMKPIQGLILWGPDI